MIRKSSLSLFEIFFCEYYKYSPSICETHACMVSIIFSQLLLRIPAAIPTARSSFLHLFYLHVQEIL